MLYRNSELRLDQIVTYINDEKINLSPVFQRGHVWSRSARQALVKNILDGKPIPAIFLYKEAVQGRSAYTYNILDGKQRLESIILFIGNDRADWQIPRWKQYFFDERHRKDVGFQVQTVGGKRTFSELDEGAIRELREYSISTIEITLTDDSTLDDMISLFVDINQYGVKVQRFDIVKAMGRNDPLLTDVFALIAQHQKRGEDIFYRTKRTPFTNILKSMNIIEKLPDQKSQVDRMWERLLEIVLFARDQKHRNPVAILKGFITKPDHPSPRLTTAETKALRNLFQFLGIAYSQGLGPTRLATDQTHFYTMVTSIIAGDLVHKFAATELIRKLLMFAAVLEGRENLDSAHQASASMERYVQLSSKQTTHVGRRDDRQTAFLAVIEAL